MNPKIYPEQPAFLDLEKEGLRLFNKGNYKASLQQFLAAFRLKPDCDAALYNIARVMDELKQPMAEDFYVAAITQGSVDAMYQLGVFYDLHGRGEEAVDPLRAFLKVYPEHDDIFAKDARRLLDKHNIYRIKLVWSKPRPK